LTLFERVLKRREVLLNNWRPVQEGIAVLATFASINSQDSSEQIDLALLSLQRAAKHEAVERKAIQDKLVALARREEARWEKGLGCETIYLQGYKQCVCIQQRAGSVTAAWIAAMVASHFPYQCCDLLDMAESAFDFWSNKGDLNFYSRLCRVSENPSLLKIATKEAHDTGALAESTRYRLLESATGEVNKQELSNESHLFGTWEQDFLLKSATLRTFLGESAKLLDKPIGFELLDAFKDDWRYDFRIAGHWLPPIISESGAITVNKEADSERTKRMFINSYEVERTRRLIRWMHTSPLH
jgi:hypothetical protein